MQSQKMKMPGAVVVDIADSSIVTAKLADNAITTAKITDANVTKQNLLVSILVIP